MENNKREVGITFHALTPEGFITPSYANDGDSGMDLSIPRDMVIHPGGIYKIPLGFSVALSSSDFELQVRSKSGRASEGLIVVNQPGTIECTYEGEVCVLMTNIMHIPIVVKAGTKIAQMVIVPVVNTLNSNVTINKTECGDKKDFKFISTRGKGGFGSTDKKRRTSMDDILKEEVFEDLVGQMERTHDVIIECCMLSSIKHVLTPKDMSLLELCVSTVYDLELDIEDYETLEELVEFIIVNSDDYK